MVMNFEEVREEISPLRNTMLLRSQDVCGQEVKSDGICLECSDMNTVDIYRLRVYYIR